MKKELRTTLRAILEKIGPDEIQRRSAQVAARLVEQPEYARAGTMLVYLSLPTEVDTTPIVLRAWQDGKRVVVPQVLWDSRQMIPIEIQSLEDDIEISAMGIRQPIRGEPAPIETIDLVIVPGIGFDTSGNRLGRGRGFYDRFLGRREFRGVACGVAFEEQITPSIPAGPTDVAMNLVVTDKQVRRFRTP